jgi:hypothetical protein
MLKYVMLLFLVMWGGLLGCYARHLWRRWREPILQYPVVIFESDDWGAGPLDQSDALLKVHDLLARFQDRSGRTPVITLGIILATADTRRIRDTGGTVYFSANLSEPVYEPLRGVLKEGCRQGVFALQLHGKEHYWPPTLMQLAAKDESVRNWLQGDGIPYSESLPPALQARWTDASSLPSRPLDSKALRIAVSEESSLFFACFNDAPRVSVATTFVWTDEVEAAWAEVGINVIITPGVRYTCRDAAGNPGGADKRMLNGEMSRGGQTYLVRDIYFEPALGHMPERLLTDVKQHARLGRPCLVEMHRFNFIGVGDRCNASLRLLATVLEELLHTLPDVRFMASLELAEAIRAKTPALVENRIRPRMRVWLRRIEEIGGFARLARITGIAIPFWIIRKAVGA